MHQIRLLQPGELSLLKNFAPPDWNADLSVLFTIHFGQPYFYPIAAEQDGVIAGCANVIWNKCAGWLGNIIVLPEFRGRGIGSNLTRHLVDFLHARGSIPQILIATSMGEPVYRKLGFKAVSQYVFLKAEQPPALLELTGIRPCKLEDTASVFRIDRAITGEERRLLLTRFLDDGWIHESPVGEVDGFFLPGLGQGLVLAENDTAGLALLGFKIGRGSTSAVVPEANTVSLEYLIKNGFQETTCNPRMVLGGDTNWHPEHVYCRGAGYCG